MLYVCRYFAGWLPIYMSNKPSIFDRKQSLDGVLSFVVVVTTNIEAAGWLHGRFISFRFDSFAILIIIIIIVKPGWLTGWMDERYDFDVLVWCYHLTPVVIIRHQCRLNYVVGSLAEKGSAGWFFEVANVCIMKTRLMCQRHCVANKMTTGTKEGDDDSALTGGCVAFEVKWWIKHLFDVSCSFICVLMYALDQKFIKLHLFVMWLEERAQSLGKRFNLNFHLE